MTQPITPLLAFLAQNPPCNIQRHEISCPYFGALRRNLGSLIRKLQLSGEQEGGEVADQFRALLLGWLTSPVLFDESISEGVSLLGDPAYVELRWGHDLRTYYQGAIEAARELAHKESPIRLALSNIFGNLQAGKRNFRIYCHKRAKPHFQSVHVSGKSPPDDSHFLHSVKDYRDSDLFDDLVKVGPLRSRGWGAAPDALLTAPRFTNLIQVVWAGCGDDPGFGYDPVSPQAAASNSERKTAPEPPKISPHVQWQTHITKTGEDPAPNDLPIEDEFGAFAEPNKLAEKRNAVIVQIDEDQGVLYPPQSRVLSFDAEAAAEEQLRHRVPGATLSPGMFLIRPLIHDVDLGGLQAEHGHYGRIWRERLIQERNKDASALIAQLRKEGLHLGYLHNAVHHWCEPPKSVIHAPQKRKHFEILIRVLGIDFERSSDPRRANAPWWQYAWNEIRRSRGEAIAAGFQEQDIVDEQLLATLASLLPEIQRLAGESQGFALPIPEGGSLKGAALFNKVASVEPGFLAPATELKIAADLNTFEQWRI